MIPYQEDSDMFETNVISLLKQIPEKNRTVLLIRHSERPSFKGIPEEKKDEVELTPKGIEMAREFGRGIKQIFPEKKLRIYNSYPKRCHMTAISILEGAKEINNRVICYEYNSPPLKSPVCNRDEYNRIKKNYEWNELINEWMEKRIPSTALVPAEEHAKDTLKTLLRANLCTSGEMAVYITYDMAIFPLIYYLFNINKQVKFLDGIVMKVDDVGLDVGFNGETRSIEYQELKI